MKTQQPVWKFVANLGDSHPIEYDGLFVYVDETGVYLPEAEVLTLISSRLATWTRHRIVLEKCTFINGVLSDNKFHPDKPAWFARDIESVMDSCDHADIIEHLCGDDVLDRARAYQSLWIYHGLENFDSYPRVVDPFSEIYTLGELK